MMANERMMEALMEKTQATGEREGSVRQLRGMADVVKAADTNALAGRCA